MKLDVCLTPHVVDEDDLKGSIVVVVDVLRACSTIVAALHNGARAVIPVADMSEAGRIAAHLDNETSVMGGERGGVPIEGYKVGNSPLEYTPEVAYRKFIVLNTTNGTNAFLRARNATQIVAGCFLNLSRIVSFLKEAESSSSADSTAYILCSGQNERPALEDILCAGMILNKLWTESQPDALTDGAHIALSQYRQDKKRLARAIFGCEHTQELIQLGYGDDVAYCAQLDALPVLPRYSDSRLILDEEDRMLSDSFVATALPDSEELENAPVSE